jgi:hypothetical protein
MPSSDSVKTVVKSRCTEVRSLPWFMYESHLVGRKEPSVKYLRSSKDYCEQMSTTTLTRDTRAIVASIPETESAVLVVGEEKKRKNELLGGRFFCLFLDKVSTTGRGSIISVSLPHGLITPVIKPGTWKISPKKVGQYKSLRSKTNEIIQHLLDQYQLILLREIGTRRLLSHSEDHIQWSTRRLRAYMDKTGRPAGR